MVLRRLLLAAAAAATVLGASAAAASVMVEASVPELAREADVIARGRVARTESHVSSDGLRLYTVVTLEVSESWKGDAGKTVQIQVPGGSRDGIAQIVQGAPQFRAGEDVVVFLRDRARRVDAAKARPLQVVAMAQGKYEVALDEAGVEVAAPDLRGVELVQPDGGEARQALRPAPVRVADLRKLVKAAAP